MVSPATVIPIKIIAVSLRWRSPWLLQIKDGNGSIIGLMIESNIHEGNQSSEQPRSEMKYGVSVTDACISWEMTDALLREIHQDLNGLLTARVA